MHVPYTLIPASDASPASRWLRLSAIVFVLAMGFSIGGSLLLRLFPSAMALFGPYYPTLVKGPTWTYMALLPVIPVLMYGVQVGWRTIGLTFVAGSVIGGASELIGTTTGFPFGAYAYTIWLGPKIADHVPYFIPPSWFAMSIVSFELANRLTHRPLFRVPVAALFMVLWDVSLDPAMNMAFPFWTYPGGGIFFGMPLSNWAGWFGVSLVIMIAYEALLRGRSFEHSWSPSFYLINCAFPLALSLLYGLYGAVGFGVVATAIPLYLVYRRSAQPSLVRT